MPLVEPSSYSVFPFLGSGHIQTIFPTLFRRVPGVKYRRERLELIDGDFLDLDWLLNGSRKLGIISHGLEGDSSRWYVRGMARALARRGWDALAWNARGCSGEPNRLLRFTHSGATEDLSAVVEHVLKRGDHQEIALIGFSLGGNITLKYLGEQGTSVDSRIQQAVAFSVPCDLYAGSIKLGLPENRIYMHRFLRCLREKIRRKMEQMPGKIDDAGYEKMRTFKDFDDRYTAPLHGFKDAEDYWRQSSSRPYLSRIVIPTLLINARNDPFLAQECFPYAEADSNPAFFFEAPRCGGHNGFIRLSLDGEYWLEKRAMEFLQKARQTTS